MPAKIKKVKAVTPLLDAYIARIGAVQLNFRRYMVKEHTGHYYQERSLIDINKDGTITYKGKAELAPTKEEEEAIAAELVGIADDWPKAATVSNILKLEVTNDENLYQFLDRDRKKIIMCQQRMQFADGKKAYLPWTWFSDGQWRQMEPDGKLPFWKPPVNRQKNMIMIHEGAKAARFCDSLVNDREMRKELKKHPWAEELSEYEHWGMIGGALAPHRADYKEIHDENPPGGVIYSCDNDYLGDKAVQIVSEYYGRAMKGIHYGGSFKHSFDLADPMPEKLFEDTPSGKRWVGGKIKDYTTFATYATEMPPAVAGAKGRPAAVLKDIFAQEWVCCMTPSVYVHREWPGKLLTTEEFNSKIHSFSRSLNTSDLMTANQAIKVDSVKYVPGQLPGVYGRGGRYFNTYCPSGVVAVQGDTKLFEEFMVNLLPIEIDRIEVMRWLATLIARPDIKMMYALLLISEMQGVGKSTLGDRILKPIIGLDNVSSPSEAEVVEGQYTYWMAHKRLAIVNEIYAGHSSAAYNKLKPMITDPTITVRKKYLADYDIDNWMHILACSNNLNALKLTGEDRRWLIPKVTEEKRPEAYWIKFNKWLTNEDGLGKIVYWAHEFLKTHQHVGYGEVAPWTTTKDNVVEEGYTPGQAMSANIMGLIRNSVEAGNPDFERCVMMDTDFIGLIQDNISDRDISYGDKAINIRKVARNKGWFVNEDRTILRDGTRGRLICLDERDSRRPPKEVFQEIIPTRIRMLGKQFLVIDGDTSELNVKRDTLDDPKTVEAINSGNLSIKGVGNG